MKFELYSAQHSGNKEKLMEKYKAIFDEFETESEHGMYNALYINIKSLDGLLKLAEIVKCDLIVSSDTSINPRSIQIYDGYIE